MSQSTTPEGQANNEFDAAKTIVATLKGLDKQQQERAIRFADSAKQVSDVLKEYRNYIHPAKELRHKVELAHNDSQMFWQITKAIVRQLLQSASV